MTDDAALSGDSAVIADLCAKLAKAEAERDAARLPRFNDDPGEGCPVPSQCLHVGDCLRRCDAAHKVGLGLGPGDNLFINCTVQEAPK